MLHLWYTHRKGGKLDAGLGAIVVCIGSPDQESCKDGRDRIDSHCDCLGDSSGGVSYRGARSSWAGVYSSYRKGMTSQDAKARKKSGRQVKAPSALGIEVILEYDSWGCLGRGAEIQGRWLWGFSTRGLEKPGDVNVSFFSKHLEKNWGRITSALPIALNAGWLVTDVRGRQANGKSGTY